MVNVKYLKMDICSLEQIIEKNKEEIRRLQKENAKISKALLIRQIMEEEMELEIAKIEFMLRKEAEDMQENNKNLLKLKVEEEN